MMRFFGWMVAVALVVGIALLATGQIGGNANVHLTERGKATINKGLNRARNGINSGFDALEDKPQKK